MNNLPDDVDAPLIVLLGCQHHGHGAVERAAAFAHQDATPTSRGIEQSYGSAVGDAYLRYMWHDSVMQAALRFGRDPEIDETVVVAHTAALREDLPVVAEGDVVKTYSAGEKRVVEAVAGLRGSFTTADVRERLTGDANLRSVRRRLAALVEAGQLERTETSNGVVTQFSDPEAPGAGQVELPSVSDLHPDDPTQYIHYTWSVRVGGGDSGESRHRAVARATLPSPDAAAATVEGDPLLS